MKWQAFDGGVREELNQPTVGQVFIDQPGRELRHAATRQHGLDLSFSVADDDASLNKAAFCRPGAVDDKPWIAASVSTTVGHSIVAEQLSD